ADRLLGYDDAAVPHVRRNRVPVDALAFLPEPLEERGRVLDLQARLTQRFALLGRQEQRKVVAMLEHEIGPAAQDPRTFLRERPPPTRVGVSRGLDRPSRLAGAHARDLRQLFA